MPAPLTLVQRARLEKIAQDNGFDLSIESTDEWLKFSSTSVPLILWLGADDSSWRVAFSQTMVAEELVGMTEPSPVPRPSGAVTARQVADPSQLHRVVRRAYQLSNTLPDELLHEFERQTKTLLQTTEVERLVVQRVGQDIFRAGLMRYWEGRCAVTGLTTPELLRASHIKPWAKCATARERLNVFNGLLLAVHLDAAFDRGFISFDDVGAMLVSPQLGAEDATRLGLTAGLKLVRLEAGHREALRWHRENVFREPAQQ